MPIPCSTCGQPKRNAMRRSSISAIRLLLLAAGLPVSAIVSCTDSEEPFPNVVTQMAEVSTEADGRLSRMLTDDGSSFRILNELYAGKTQATYRMLCNYVVEPEGATLMGTSGVWVLRPDEKPQKTLPLTIVSAWKSGRYANLHLQYMRKSARHTITLSQDSVADGITYLTIHHPWVNDVQAWTVDDYASIPLDELPTPHIMINKKYEFER